MQASGSLYPLFLGLIKAPVPPSRPAITWAVARKSGQIRRACGGTGATRSPFFTGEHGEDPQFDRAEHDATLWQRRGTQKVPRCWLRAGAVQASRVKRSA